MFFAIGAFTALFLTSVASFLVLGGGGGGGGKTPKCTDRKKNWKKIYMCERASASETYIFRSPNTSARTINAVSFYYLWHGAVYRQYNDKILTLSIRASGASQLRKF